MRQRHRRNIRGIRCHKATRARTWSVDNLRISEPVQVFVELASTLALPDLVAAGDAIASKGLASVADLRKYAGASTLPRARLARAAAGFVRGGSESPMESKARLLLTLAGLPEPEINAGWVDDFGRQRRYDLVFRQSRTIVEYDGRHHAEDGRQWRSDISRREALENDGWRLLVLTAPDILRNPEAAVLRVFRILKERGEPGLPRSPLGGWRRHFTAT